MKTLILLMLCLITCKTQEAKIDIKEFRCGENQEAIEIAQTVLIPRLKKIKSKTKELVITSGYRSPEYNKKIGGASDSDHIYKKNPLRAGVDVRVLNSAERYNLLKWALAYSTPRIGIANAFVHLGYSENIKYVAWIYKDL